MTRKSMLAAAVIAVLGVSAVANAQSLGTTEQTTQASKTQTPLNPSTLGASSSVGATTNAVIGWYYGHALYCLAYWDGTDTWQYLYTPENGWWWIKANVATPFVGQMTTACQTGNLVAFYIYNTAGNWSQMWTYDHK